MKSTISPKVKYRYVEELTDQLSHRQKVRLSKHLARQLAMQKLMDLLQHAKPKRVSERMILEEVDAVRAEMYAKSLQKNRG